MRFRCFSASRRSLILLCGTASTRSTRFVKRANAPGSFFAGFVGRFAMVVHALPSGSRVLAVVCHGQASGAGICEIAHIIHPGEAGHRFMAVLTFKFDESYRASRALIVAGWLADDRQWKRLRRRWCNAIAFENRTLPDEMKISRYHAAEMNANDGEYKGWENESKRKLRFVRKLLKFVSNGQMAAIACGVDLAVARGSVPGSKEEQGYVVCMKQIMAQIAIAMDEAKSTDQVAIIHDHGDWDVAALKGYNRMVDDFTWSRRTRFVSITPLTWRQDVGLQSADLIAYESMRNLDQILHSGGDMRKPLKALLGMNERIYGTWFDKAALQQTKGRLDAHSRENEAVGGSR